MAKDKKKSVQVPYEFFALTQLLLWELEEFQLNDNVERYKKRLQYLADSKFEAMKRHDLYTGYKTSVDNADREKFRLDYLESVGMRDSFRY